MSLYISLPMWRLPHVCGGEPAIKGRESHSLRVFPTCVGVNRTDLAGKPTTTYSLCRKHGVHGTSS